MVTLDTVKKHVSHVLGKLGAANRTEAVARARELSLIPDDDPIGGGLRARCLAGDQAAYAQATP